MNFKDFFNRIKVMFSKTKALPSGVENANESNQEHKNLFSKSIAVDVSAEQKKRREEVLNNAVSEYDVYKYILLEAGIPENMMNNPVLTHKLYENIENVIECADNGYGIDGKYINLPNELYHRFTFLAHYVDVLKPHAEELVKIVKDNELVNYNKETNVIEFLYPMSIYSDKEFSKSTAISIKQDGAFVVEIKESAVRTNNQGRVAFGDRGTYTISKFEKNGLEMNRTSSEYVVDMEKNFDGDKNIHLTTKALCNPKTIKEFSRSNSDLGLCEISSKTGENETIHKRVVDLLYIDNAIMSLDKAVLCPANTGIEYNEERKNSVKNAINKYSYMKEFKNNFNFSKEPVAVRE